MGEQQRTMASQNVSKKRKFVADGVFFAELNELFTRELAEDGYSGVEVRQTPHAVRSSFVLPAHKTCLERRAVAFVSSPPLCRRGSDSCQTPLSSMRRRCCTVDSVLWLRPSPSSSSSSAVLPSVGLLRRAPLRDGKRRTGCG